MRATRRKSTALRPGAASDEAARDVPGYFFEPLRFVVRFEPFFVPFRPPFFFVGIGSTLRNVVGVVRSKFARATTVAHHRERDPGCQGSGRAHRRDFQSEITFTVSENEDRRAHAARVRSNADVAVEVESAWSLPE